MMNTLSFRGSIPDADAPDTSFFGLPLKGMPGRKGSFWITDLDGTFLDRKTYSPAWALPSLRRALNKGIQVAFCSSKTPAEQQHLQSFLEIRVPFITENGSALYLPTEQFPSPPPLFEQKGDWYFRPLGQTHPEISTLLHRLEEEQDWNLGRMSRMPLSELRDRTGLEENAALRARTRLYSETLTAPLSPEKQETINRFLQKHGLQMECGGRFYTVYDRRCDKGRACRLLKSILEERHGPLLTLGIGDSANDRRMLEAVDFPVLVQKTDGSHEKMDIPNLTRIPAIGPLGWQKMANEWLKAML